jgi:hypothetical protein
MFIHLQIHTFLSAGIVNSSYAKGPGNTTEGLAVNICTYKYYVLINVFLPESVSSSHVIIKD